MSSPKFEPYIASETVMREFTVRAVITGAVLGMIFGASSLYLVLKVGLTVSASIPVAVISLAMFRGLSKLGVRDSTILENNITQTAGSAGESLAFGIGVTMPAILILGFDLELTRVLLVALLGGVLGILMMIPLRRALIVKEHGVLKYPEGTACAAVLKAGANAEDQAAASPAAKAEMQASGAGTATSLGAKVIFGGFGIGLVYTTLNLALKGWKDVSEKVFGAPFKSGSVSVEVSPALLGVGYIIGPRIASIMCAGGVLSYLLLIPLIKFFGESIASPLSPATTLIRDMGPNQIRSAYILYIGAGAVAAGGIFSLIQSAPTIWHGLREGLRDLGIARGDASAGEATPRPERNIPMKFVAIGVVALLAVITFAPTLEMNLLGALLIVVFGFLFVTVSSRLTGEIGSSSNPISGMTVATLLFTCLIFLLVGWTGGTHYVTALSVGAIVCIAASNGGTTSQDLKTGFLLGATPKFQQWAIIAGAALSAVCLGPILLVLNNTRTVYVPVAEVAPAGLQTDAKSLVKREALKGPQARDDAKQYFVWQKTDDAGGPAGQYLVNDEGKAVWLVDPGINGTHEKRPDGSTVRKFDAPKATLMSYIIKGILDRKLPWALVLLGVMIAVTLELSFVPALAFAVGVYLPLSSSSPIFIGGFIRWLVDRHARRQPKYAVMSPDEFAQETDKSPGVLLSSGYIAGGAIAGIIIAIVQGVLDQFDTKLTQWSTAHNPFFEGPNSDALSLIPFAVICVVLYLVGREKMLAPNNPADMTDDREAILSRVRGALAPLRERAPLPTYDLDMAVMRTLIAGRDLAELFAERTRRVNGMSFTDPMAVVAHLRAGGWLRGYCDPALWPRLAPYFSGGDFTIEHDFDRTRIDDYTFGITRAAGAIAESGTIVLNDATTSRRLAALAPWVHIAVVERATIFSDLTEAVMALGADRNVIWCTGPSKTADVEGILIEGVHGPGTQIALIV